MPNPPVKLGENGAAFAANLRATRSIKGVTIDEMRRRMAMRGHHLTSDQITRIEAGQRHATIDDLCHIARALEVRVNRLVAPSHLELAPNRPLTSYLADSGVGGGPR